MINLEKNSRQSLYTDHLNELNKDARTSLRLLLEKYGMESFRGDCYATYIYDDCEELLVDRIFESTDYPLILSYSTEKTDFELSNRPPYNHKRVRAHIDSTDDLCILADYLYNKFNK